MWDTYQLPHFGNFSLRKIAVFFIAALLAALFVTTAHSTPANAAPATWEGDSLKYEDKTFTKTGGVFPQIGSEFDTYVYKADDQATKALVIAVPRSADKTKEIPNVEIREYEVDGGGLYSKPGPPQTITIAAPAAGGEGNTNATSCDIAGVGWIICGPARWIANGMDLIYGWISDFLTVRPLSDDTQNGMYLAWDIVRGVANACFILAFLVIIYSQITSYGISNYEIKKMIPKLIIAAVLVNVSYYICAYAVDLSNIMGNAVQNAFIEVREVLLNSQNTNEGWDATAFNFKNVTEYILSGGALIGGGFMGLTAFAGGAIGGSVSGLVFMLFPVLIAGVVSVTVALIILAARQALITVLIVVSPLAFVAFLLPNTEKWFEKWRGLFTTMLMVFPLFSLLFGGSQLASFLILQNADQLTIVLLALFIQVAPLALTPFLLQFSGSLLGRLAGMVNNPQRGIIDRAKNYSTERAEVRKARGFEDAAKGRGTMMQRYAFRREQSRLNRESWKKRGEAFTDASWHNDSRYHLHHSALGEADLRKNVGESSSNLAFERRKSTDDRLRRYVGAQRANEEGTKMLQSYQDATWEEMKSRNMTSDNYFSGFAQEARATAQQQRIAESRLTAANAMQKIEYANDLIKSESLQRAAGGIASHGAQRTLAAAVSEYRKDYGDRINEANAILKHYNLSGAQRQAHALGQEVVVYDDNNNMKILRKDSLFTREAAIEAQMSTGTYQDIEAIVSRSGGELEKFKTTISDAIASNRLGSKAIFMGGKTIDDVSQGKITDMSQLMVAVTSTIAKGKISSTDLSTNDSKALERIFQAAQARDTTGLTAEEAANLDASIAALKQSAESVLSNPNVGRDLKENSRLVLEQIRTLP